MSESNGRRLYLFRLRESRVLKWTQENWAQAVFQVMYAAVHANREHGSGSIDEAGLEVKLFSSATSPIRDVMIGFWGRADAEADVLAHMEKARRDSGISRHMLGYITSEGFDRLPPFPAPAKIASETEATDDDAGTPPGSGLPRADLDT